jgi:hypothetical protein
MTHHSTVALPGNPDMSQYIYIYIYIYIITKQEVQLNVTYIPYNDVQDSLVRNHLLETGGGAAVIILNTLPAASQ